ncbi:MAG: phytoene desaturase [Deltaproteobacteria bacterium]|nr:phytoene desaturase [Deltaproteobacteria bacterium]NND30446.1 phytoene desaturase [Myxococcales bacterium]MBT8465015.1 phytoene desaturase [Deltaproteobacteria bacterium]MBT8480738.1 phytoene desaturase [Deltaproteobacteria bacterium]NNK44892.1 phytoene desaturase [Myxococcales bacterium]
MSKQAIVIGAGFGGLAAAARLRARGHQVTILEAGGQAGGRARAFESEGFHFDAGPTVITAPYLFDELFELFGKDRRDYFQLVPVDPFYRVVFPDGRSFDYVGDDERLFAQIAKFNPADVDGYKRLVEHSRRIFDVGYTELVDADFSKFGDMMRIVPDLVRLRAYKSLYGLVARYIKDDALRQVFTFQPLLIGGNPFRVPGIYLLIHWLERKWGVHFAMGGTTAIVQGLTRLLGEVGVDLRLEAPVERIEVQNGRAKGVLLADGTFLESEIIVSNADPAMVYTKLIDAAARRKHSDASIARKRYSMSLFVGYFGTKKTYPDLAHHSILLGPRYRGLLTDIFDRKTLSEDFSLYLHAPTRTDPSLAPPGGESFYVLSPVPNQASGIDWSVEGPRYMDRILDALDAEHLPGLRDNLVTDFHVDPTYFEGELRSYQGAAFGLEPTLRQSAYFRFHNASEDVAGLYFVGAGVHPGAGLPGVLSSAKVLDRVVPAPATKGRVLSLPEAVSA